MNPQQRYEQHCRTLMNAYPRHYRETRGAEVLGTLLDAAEPGRTRPTLRESLAIIRGGLAARRRTRPPLHHRIAFWWVNKRVPYEYRWWARDATMSRFFRTRNMLRYLILTYLLMLPTALYFAWHYNENSHNIRTFFSALGVAAFCFLPSIRRRKLNRYEKKLLWKHEFHPDGTPFETNRPETAPSSSTSPLQSPSPPDH